jgi:hypothetical protein
LFDFQSGSTPSSGTGPFGAHDGYYYLYLESDYTYTGGNASLSIRPGEYFSKDFLKKPKMVNYGRLIRKFV